MIRYENGTYHYFDRNGTELHDGDVVQYVSGNRQKLYLTENGLLGTDATNPVWIADEVHRGPLCFEEAGAGRAREEGKRGVGCGVIPASKHDTGM